MKKEKLNAYETLGKYIIKFQEIHLFLQLAIQYILNKKGLNNENGNIISRIILAERSIDNLLNIYKSLIGEIFLEDSEDFKIIKMVTDFIKENILKHRNDIVHSFLYVDENDLDNIKMCREKYASKKGFNSGEDSNIKSNHLSEQLKIIQEISFLLYTINLNLNNNFKIAGKFNNGNEIVTISFDIVTKILKDLK